jgi:hypothetical protein
MNLENVHLRGTRAAQPAAADVAEGTIYCVTDESGILEMRDSTVAWVSYSPPAAISGINQLTGDVTAGPGTGSQAATLSTTSVVAGSYTKTSITVDAKGRLTAASSGGVSDVTGPGSATDEAIARFDGTTGKVLQNSVITVSDTGIVTYPDDIRQTFNPGANNAGFNVGSHTADPSSPSNGDIYYDSTNNLLRARINGAWASLGAIPTVRRQITTVIDGGGAVITTGIKGYLSLPLGGTWKKWRILSVDSAVTSGSIVIDVYKDTFANYPPTVADTITGSAKPTLTTATSAESSTLTGWTTTFTTGDCLGINVDSATSVTKVSFTLEYE